MGGVGFEASKRGAWGGGMRTGGGWTRTGRAGFYSGGRDGDSGAHDSGGRDGGGCIAVATWLVQVEGSRRAWSTSVRARVPVLMDHIQTGLRSVPCCFLGRKPFLREK